MDPRPQNAVLQDLSAEDWHTVAANLRPIDLATQQILAEMGDEIEWVIFPESGLVSVISMLVSGAAVETSVIGREGAVGFIEALGSRTSHSRWLVQMPGKAFRMRADAYRAAFHGSRGMQRTIHRQYEVLQAEAHVAIACHSLHPVEDRLCRWLLECQDLSGGVEALPLTQELLGVMLAVQRTTVSKFAAVLQDAGLIRYSRGMVRIIDRDGLEHRACECRGTLRALRAELAPATFGHLSVVQSGS
jgi:CRP-like cAMP-binding protein